MALEFPYRQHNYMGEHANDAAVLTFIQANDWDSAGDGTGNPREGMFYYNTTDDRYRFYADGAWYYSITEKAAEYPNLSLKRYPVYDDELLLEDSEDSDSKKRINLKSLVRALMVDKVFFHEEFAGAALTNAWNTITTGSAQIYLIQTDSSGVAIDTGSTINSQGTLNWNAVRAIKAGRRAEMYFLVSANSNVNIDCQVGAKGASHYALFDRIGSGNWFAKTYDGIAVTSTDLGSTLGTTAQRLEIDMSGSSIEFRVNNVIKATHTTNIPTKRMEPHFFAENKVASSKFVYIRNFTWTQNRIA